MIPERMAAHAAKSALRLDNVIAAGAQDSESVPAGGAELASVGILVLTPGASHAPDSSG